MVERQNYRGGSAIAAYPFSRATRFELGAGAHAVTFTRDIRDRVYDTASEDLLERRESEEEIARPLGLFDLGGALVHDTSYYGALSPILGRRYRLEFKATRGSIEYETAVLDWRQYVMPVQPVTIAVRAMHVGRYGRDAEHPQ